MSRPRKHKFRSLEVGESYTAENAPRWLRSAIYNYATSSGRKYSVCKVTPGQKDSAFVITRTA